MTTKTFKIWDEYNSTSGLGKTQIRHNFISISPKGKITFNSGICQSLSITDKTRITFVEGDDSSFFLCKTTDSGLTFNRHKGSKKFQQMGASKLCAYLSEKYGFKQSVRVRVSTVPETFPKQDGLPAAGFRVYLNELNLKK